MRLEINYKKKVEKSHKHMEAKQYATKQPIELWRNPGRNWKVSRDKWKWKHYDSKPMGGSTSTSRGTFLATQAHIRQQGESQINNLPLNLK